MKPKTIKSVLRKKFHNWSQSIKGKDLRKLVLRDGLVTGGSIVSLLMNEKPNDFDVYFTTRETTEAVAKYYVEQFKQNPPKRFKDNDRSIKIWVDAKVPDRIKIVIDSAGIAGDGSADDYEYYESHSDGESSQSYVNAVVDVGAAVDVAESDSSEPKYEPIFISSNAITLSDRIQIVIRFYGPVEAIHTNYDFVHCTCSWRSDTGELTLPKDALLAIMNKDLFYMGGSKYPLCSIIRTRKFIQRGWRINAGQFVKMAWDLNKLDLNNIDVLEDQMVGVDSAYFEEIVRLLRNNIGDDKSKPVDETYLMQIIDAVF